MNGSVAHVRVGVTGTTGFVGQRLMQLKQGDSDYRSLDLRGGPIAQLDLEGLDAIVHLAGLAHRMTPVPAGLYDKINYRLTRELAERAHAQGVKQFIYISTTKVYGEDAAGHFDEHSPCGPVDPYGESKRKAEEHLLSMEADSFHVAIVRPPLVYGAGVKGNMRKLLELARRPIPLPLGDTRNQRSMVYVDNLIALLDRILERRASGVFIAGDAAPISTSELLLAIRRKMGNRSSIFSLPAIGRAMIRMLRPAQYLRLFGSYVVDNRGTNQRLDFTPPHTLDDGVGVMVEWFLKDPSK